MGVNGGKVRTGSDLWAEVADWLFAEAELLDSGREREWLAMVSPEIAYQIPIRQTVERARGSGVHDDAFHLDERYGSLEVRVRRNETTFAWAEDPPSRIRHFVSNIRVVRLDHDQLDVRSNLLLYRTRYDQTVPQLLSGERQDVLRREGGALKLYRRVIVLDVTTVGTHNLAIIL